jgi:hypothetical protein
MTLLFTLYLTAKTDRNITIHITPVTGTVKVPAVLRLGRGTVDYVQWVPGFRTSAAAGPRKRMAEQRHVKNGRYFDTRSHRVVDGSHDPWTSPLLLDSDTAQITLRTLLSCAARNVIANAGYRRSGGWGN